jgi:hypothetical protein
MKSGTMGPASRAALWGGRIASGLVVLFLLADSAGKLLEVGPVLEGFVELGYRTNVSQGIGIVILLCAVLYAWPRTAVLGAILTTGLLGGAIASHVRVGDPLFTHVLFGVYVGALAWGGLFLRDPRLRALMPLSKGA